MTWSCRAGLPVVVAQSRIVVRDDEEFKTYFIGVYN